MARVVALVPDLMFGSRVSAALGAAGHDVALCATPEPAAAQAAAADLLVVDLAAPGADPAGALAALRAAGAAGRSLAVYSHVDADTRRQALHAGFDLVVPRSRFVREGPELVAALLVRPG